MSQYAKWVVWELGNQRSNPKYALSHSTGIIHGYHAPFIQDVHSRTRTAIMTTKTVF